MPMVTDRVHTDALACSVYQLMLLPFLQVERPYLNMASKQHSQEQVTSSSIGINHRTQRILHFQEAKVFYKVHAVPCILVLFILQLDAKLTLQLPRFNSNIAPLCI